MSRDIWVNFLERTENLPVLEKIAVVGGVADGDWFPDGLSHSPLKKIYAEHVYKLGDVPDWVTEIGTLEELVCYPRKLEMMPPYPMSLPAPEKLMAMPNLRVVAAPKSSVAPLVAHKGDAELPLILEWE
jgi:hypothetical protein